MDKDYKKASFKLSTAAFSMRINSPFRKRLFVILALICLKHKSRLPEATGTYLKTVNLF